MFVHLVLKECMNRAGQSVIDSIEVRKFDGREKMAGRTHCVWPDAVWMLQIQYTFNPLSF